LYYLFFYLNEFKELIISALKIKNIKKLTLTHENTKKISLFFAKKG